MPRTHWSCFAGAFLISVSIADSLAAQSRQLGSDGDVSFSIQSSYKCTPTAPVTVSAPDRSLFDEEQQRLQRLLGLIRIALSFECPQVSAIEITGVVAGYPVYRGMAREHDGWRLASAQPMDVAEAAESAQRSPLGSTPTPTVPARGAAGRAEPPAPSAPGRPAVGFELEQSQSREGVASAGGRPEASGTHFEMDDLAVASENWARRSSLLLSQGLRREAIVSALKGLPDEASGSDLVTRYAPAYLALYAALRAQLVSLPVGGRIVEEIDGVTLSPSADRAVTESRTAHGKRQLALWDVESGAQLAVLVEDLGLQYHFRTAAFSADGRHLAVAGHAGMLHLFDARDGSSLAERQAIRPLLPPPDDPQFVSLAFSPSGEHLVTSGGYPADLTVWRVPTLEPVASLGPADYARLDVQSEWVHAYANFANDEAVCVFLAKSKRHPGEYTRLVAAAWHLAEARVDPLHVREGEFTVLNLGAARGSCAQNLSWVAMAYSDAHHVGHLDVVRADGGSAPYQLSNLVTVGTSFDPSGRYFAVFGHRGWAYHALNDFSAIAHPGSPPGFVFEPGAVFNADTRQPLSRDLSSTAEQGGLRLWEMMPEGGELIAWAVASLDEAERQLLAAQRIGGASRPSLPDAEVQEGVIAQSENWARRSTELLRKGFRREAIVAALKGLPAELQGDDLERFAPAHLALYSAMRSDDVRLRIDDRFLSRHGGVAGSTQGRRAITGALFPDGGTRLELWNADTGQPIAVLTEALPHWLNHAWGQLAISPDGETFAFALFDGVVAVFDTKDGQRIGSWRVSEDRMPDGLALNQVEFSPSGAHLMALDRTAGRLLVWRLFDSQPVLSLDLAALGGEAARRFGHVMVLGAHFANAGSICVTLAGSSGRGPDVELRWPQLAVVDLESGVVRTAFQLELPSRRIDSGIDRFTCSPDLRWIAAMHTDDQGVRHFEVFESASGARHFSQRNVAIDTVLFSPDSDMVAVADNEGWSFVEPAQQRTVQYPGVVSGYAPQIPRIIDAESDAVLAYDFASMASYATTNVWKPFPQGTALIVQALQGLTDAERLDVEQHRP